MDLRPHSSAPSASSASDDASEPTFAGRFRRSARLLRHADFDRVYKQGRRHFGTHMTVFYWQRPTLIAACYRTPDTSRIGFTVGRVLGGAVVRNRIKRRLREAVRANLPALTAPVDVVINPKKSALAAAFPVLRNDVARAFSVIQEKCSGRKDSAPDSSG